MRRIVGVFAFVLCLIAVPWLAAGAPGDLDPSFGIGGKVITDLGDNISALALAVALQADGKVVVAGTGIGATEEVLLVRYNPDGSVDIGFGTNGQVATGLTRGISGTFLIDPAVIVQPDGKIVVAATILGTTHATDFDFALARFNPNGSPDETFGSGGKVATNFVLDAQNRGFAEGAQALHLQPDGKLVAAGPFGFMASLPTGFALARYNLDGTLDPTFGVAGKVTTDFTDIASADVFAKALVLQDDGKLIAAGSAGAGADFALARYNSNGSLDATFGTGGRVLTNFGGTGRLYALVRQPDGKLVGAGTPSFTLARYNSDGTLDVSFGTDGKVTTDVGSGGSSAFALALQSDGKLVAAGGGLAQGGLGQGLALARYNVDGSLDTTFGTGGEVVSPDVGFVAFALVVQPDGKLVAAGATDDSSGNGTAWVLARYETGVVPPPPSTVPVILVHGWRGGPNSGTWGVMKELLEEAGFSRVEYVDYGSDVIDDISVLADVLRLRIRDVLESSGASKVDIIAHSMGGLVTRAYITDMHPSAGIPGKEYQREIRRLVLVGTPNYGGAGADFVGVCDTVFICSEVEEQQGEQMRYGSNLVWVLHNKWNDLLEQQPSKVPQLLTVAGTGSIGNNDGLVYVASAALAGNVPVRYVPYVHGGGWWSWVFLGTTKTLVELEAATPDPCWGLGRSLLRGCGSGPENIPLHRPIPHRWHNSESSGCMG